MKTLQFFCCLSFLLMSVFSFAQTQKQTVKVWGECGMCKKTIEKAAKQAGATAANWNVDSKILAVSFDAKQTNVEAIEKSIAAAGYDTKNFTASDDAYNKLHSCCHYERKSTTSENAAKTDQCCKDKKDGKECTKEKMKDGKNCCKDKKADCKKNM